MKDKINILILPNIRSVVNVGAMFRTADAAGIDRIYLCGITPAPVDRFGRERSDFIKASLGAEKSVAWEQKEDEVELIKELKNEGFQIIAIEQDPKSVDYKEVKAKDKNAFILGPEVEGLPKEILDISDVIAEIPMHGTKESLNVSTSLGIALFRILEI